MDPELACDEADRRIAAGDLNSRSSCRAASGPRSLALLAGRVGLPSRPWLLAVRMAERCGVAGRRSGLRCCATYVPRATVNDGQSRSSTGAYPWVPAVMSTLITE
jgi:hypothetical protein